MALMLSENGRIFMRSATTETLGIPTPLGQWTAFPLSDDTRFASIAVFNTQVWNTPHATGAVRWMVVMFSHISLEEGRLHFFS
jgi:hypothetical protein